MPGCRWAARLSAVLLALGLALGAAAQTPDPETTRAAHALFERWWNDNARWLPEFATFRGDHRFGDRFADATPQGRAAYDAQVRAWLAEARAIPRERLSPTDRVSLDLFIEQRENEVALQAFPGFRAMTLRSLHGVQSLLAGLLRVTPVHNAERIEQLLRRLDALPQRMDQEVASLRGALATGWVASRDVLAAVLRQIDGQLALEGDRSPWFEPFTRLPQSLPEADREAWRARGRDAVARQVVPAMRRLRAFVVDEAMPRAPASGSLAGYPDGERVYALLVRQNTTTSLSPAEVHAIGQRELARLRGEMEAVMRQAKFDGDFAAFVRHLNTDPRFFHATPEALLAGYRDIAKRLDAEMPRLFAELPRAPYGIVAMPPHLGNAAEYYNAPAIDGSRAGLFFANTVAWRKRPIWAMETLVAHEAVPGHHLQIARAIELRGLPAFRRVGGGYTVYSEGWALYAETLGAELGLYTDPYSRFGHLQWQAFRAARLVVDTAIHTQGWSRDRAIEFMIERTGVDRELVESEIDRYTSRPGQALAYMIGKLKIDELRDRARARLGARFDIRRFHNALLDQGPVPLSVLERLIDEWIAAQATPAG